MSRINILIADDEADFLLSLAKVLARRGMVVHTVGDGRRAVDACAEKSFDVIVLDLRMPVMDGLSALKEIRQNDALTPVFILSGHADLAYVAEALRGGAADYLIKPCSVEELVGAIETAVERKTILQEAAGKIER